jgi:hypothetical protein
LINISTDEDQFKGHCEQKLKVNLHGFSRPEAVNGISKLGRYQVGDQTLMFPASLNETAPDFSPQRDDRVLSDL